MLHHGRCWCVVCASGPIACGSIVCCLGQFAPCLLHAETVLSCQSQKLVFTTCFSRPPAPHSFPKPPERTRKWLHLDDLTGTVFRHQMNMVSILVGRHSVSTVSHGLADA